MKRTLTSAILIVLSLSASLMACGPQAFVPSAVTSAQQAPGGTNIPPKVDIIMGISSSGTMGNIFPNMTAEIPTFVQGLQASGWDYRFLVIPLSQYANIATLHTETVGSQSVYDAPVNVSYYDTNYVPLGLWIPPYPGASSTNPLLGINATLFSQIFVFPSVSSVEQAQNDSHETGFQNQLTYLSRTDVETEFLRPDALLAIVTLSNNDDHSGGNWNTVAWNGPVWTSTDPNYLPDFANSMIQLKGSSALVKYYSLVAHLTDTCRGYGSVAGDRYESMASLLNGISVDICTNPLSSALGAVATNLQTYRMSFVKTALVIGTQPNPATITVTKYIGGNANQAVVLSQSASNGWTYNPNAGVQTVYTVTSPVNMDQETGYVIQLNGSAQLSGNDTATVQYENVGAVAAH